MRDSQIGSTRRTTRRAWAVVVIVGVLMTLVLGSMIAYALTMVAAGHGLETHTTAWLVEDSWLGFLIAMGVGAVAVIAGLAWRVIQQRRDDLAWKRHDDRWASGGE